MPLRLSGRLAHDRGAHSGQATFDLGHLTLLLLLSHARRLSFARRSGSVHGLGEARAMHRH